jgi:hypothetical protein
VRERDDCRHLALGDGAPSDPDTPDAPDTPDDVAAAVAEFLADLIEGTGPEVGTGGYDGEVDQEPEDERDDGGGDGR